MNETHTTAPVQHYLDDLVGVRGDSPAELIVRALLARAITPATPRAAVPRRHSRPAAALLPTQAARRQMLGTARQQSTPSRCRDKISAEARGVPYCNQGGFHVVHSMHWYRRYRTDTGRCHASRRQASPTRWWREGSSASPAHRCGRLRAERRDCIREPKIQLRVDDLVASGIPGGEY